MPYRSTQKTLRALALISRYTDSAISRANDDGALQETKDGLSVLKGQITALIEGEEATRVAVEEAPVEEAVAE
jgi:hypothetical protein